MVGLFSTPATRFARRVGSPAMRRRGTRAIFLPRAMPGVPPLLRPELLTGAFVVTRGELDHSLS